MKESGHGINISLTAHINATMIREYMKLYTSSAAWTRIKMSKEIKINSEQNNIQ